MRKFFPQSLTTRTIIVLVVGLLVSHLISMIIYSGDRVEALTLLDGRNIAKRIANITHLVDETPTEWQNSILEGVSEPGFVAQVSPESLLLSQPDPGWHVHAMRTFLEESLNGRQSSEIKVQILDFKEKKGYSLIAEHENWLHTHLFKMLLGVPVHQTLRASIKINDGRWLNFTSDIPQSMPLWTSRSTLSIFAMAIAVILLSVLVVTWLSSPLKAFAQAARRLGRDVHASPLPETGPQEVREAAIAFNEMQRRLKDLIDNRTRMLAALSHDFRTPITLLRLRIEMFEDSEDRTRMLATLAGMEEMIAQTLQFAKEESMEEARRKIDVGALVGTISDDMNDAGFHVSFEHPKTRIVLECQHIALKRAITNLVENAVKYGAIANIKLETTKTGIKIQIEDDGPGIPEDKLGLVFQPFFRCDESRSVEGGGVGLGLSLAKSIALNHGGELLLRNRSKAGLVAELIIPFQN